jgi:hypothetical protein
VGLVIGKGGETIKSMQLKSGARIQVCYLIIHLPVFTVAAIRNKVTLSLLVAVCLLVFALPSKLNVAS